MNEIYLKKNEWISLRFGCFYIQNEWISVGWWRVSSLPWPFSTHWMNFVEFRNGAECHEAPSLCVKLWVYFVTKSLSKQLTFSWVSSKIEKMVIVMSMNEESIVSVELAISSNFGIIERTQSHIRCWALGLNLRTLQQNNNTHTHTHSM